MKKLLTSFLISFTISIYAASPTLPNAVLRAATNTKAVPSLVNIDTNGNMTIPGTLGVTGQASFGSGGTVGGNEYYDVAGTKYAAIQSPNVVATNNTTLLPDRVLAAGLIKTTPNEPGTNTLDLAVVNTDYVKPATETGTHSTPATGNPLSPTWEGGIYIIWYGATGTINLPAVAGYQARGVIIYNTGAFTITIDANSSEVIVRDGTVQTGGVSITLSSGAGNYVCLISDGNRWVTLGYKGTLAQGS
jgi:hypothetical protein